MVTMILETQEHQRRRSNSQSQVSAASSFSGLPPVKSTFVSERQKLPRRNQADFYVTLVSLNDTFDTKYIRVPYFPETCKLGRPTGAKVKPNSTNGYFDSRVLSRNHACIFIDPHGGKLFIQDMGSSNGTFVNLEKISNEPVHVKVGDTINLGFNIQVETNHKQISAKVEAINVMSYTPKSAVLSALPMLTQTIIDSFSDAEMKHYDFVLRFLSEVFGEESKPENKTEAPGETSTDNSTPTVGSVLELAMFSDLIPVMESPVYHLKPGNAGFFENSNITYSSELQSSLDQLTVNLMKIRQQNAALKSIESVLVNYSNTVTEINTKYLLLELEKAERAAAIAEKALRAENARSAMLLLESDQKLKDQLQLIANLQSETAKLRAEKEDLKLQHDVESTRTVEVASQISPQPSPPSECNQEASADLHLDNSIVDTVVEVPEVVQEKPEGENRNSSSFMNHRNIRSKLNEVSSSNQEILLRGQKTTNLFKHPMFIGLATAAVAGMVIQQYNK